MTPQSTISLFINRLRVFFGNDISFSKSYLSSRRTPVGVSFSILDPAYMTTVHILPDLLNVKGFVMEFPADITIAEIDYPLSILHRSPEKRLSTPQAFSLRGVCWFNVFLGGIYRRLRCPYGPQFLSNRFQKNSIASFNRIYFSILFPDKFLAFLNECFLFRHLSLLFKRYGFALPVPELPFRQQRSSTIQVNRKEEGLISMQWYSIGMMLAFDPWKKCIV